MFQRGQKIVVLESSAKSGARPRAGDVGYLDNLYLFPRLRFILLDAFFFAYNGANRNRAEKKKFIIDLGMCRDMRFKISHKGIPVRFFVNNIDLVNLSSVGYRIKTPNKGDRLLISYPQIHSNYGIWPHLKKRSEANFIEDKIVKIPYGQIALFNTKFDHKYSMVECDEIELIAWLRSMIPMIGSALNVLCDYSRFYPLDSMENGYFDIARRMWSEIFSRVMCFDFPTTDAAQYDTHDSISAYRFERFSSDRSYYRKEVKLLVKNTNHLSSLTSIFLQRLDSYHLNGYLNPEANPTANSLSLMWDSCNIINGADSVNLSFASSLHLYDLVRSMFFRAAIMPNSTYVRLKPLARCLPEEWRKDDELNCRVKILDDIKAAANSDSSALNRIYEVVK